MSANSSPREPGEIITFYSYKGGTGRSMALANVACLLAQSKEGYDGVLAIDWDLEAPGLHRYFADRFQRRFPADSPPRSLERHPGLIDLFERFRDEIAKLPPIGEEPNAEIQRQLRSAIDLYSFIIPTDVPNLFIMKAGCFDENYARRVNTFAWEPLYQQAPWLISFFADWLTSLFRYTLIDSRTGITDTSGICTMLLPDKLVMVFTPNQQSLDGVLEMTERATNYRRRSSDMRPLSVFPLASRIESSEPDLRAKWRKAEGFGYQPRFEALFKKVWQLEDCNLESYLNEVQIQHASAYAYGERVAVLAEQSDDRTSLRRAFVSFAERLVTLDEPWESAPVKSANTPNPAADTAEALYAQLTPDGQEAARRLFLQLIRLPLDATRPVAREIGPNVLSKEQQEMIGSLTSAKLVMSRANPGSGVAVCLADETLITDWRRLAEWIAADAAFLNWRDTLDSAQTSWEKHNQSKELLLRGKPLEEAVAKLARAKDLNSAETLYIGYAIVARDRRKRVASISTAAAVCAVVLGFFAVKRFESSSALAQAEAILGQSGIDAAIRAERVYAKSDKIDTALRNILGETPEPVRLIPVSQTPDHILFSPDETFLAVAHGNTVSYFNISSGSNSKTIELQQNGRINSLAFSPDGNTIASASNGTVQLWSAAGKRAAFVVIVQPGVQHIAYSPDGKYLATADDQSTARIWLSSDGSPLGVSKAAGDITALCFFPQGNQLALGGADKEISIFAIPQFVQSTHFSTGAAVQALACPAADRIWAVLTNGLCRRLGLDGKGKTWTLYGQPGALSAVSPKGTYFATVVSNGSVLISRPDPENAKQYSSLSGVALAGAGCQKLKMAAQLFPNYAKACPAE